MEDKDFNREFSQASKAASGDVSAADVSDMELAERAEAFLVFLKEKYPHLAKKINKIQEWRMNERIVSLKQQHGAGRQLPCEYS